MTDQEAITAWAKSCRVAIRQKKNLAHIIVIFHKMTGAKPWETGLKNLPDFKRDWNVPAAKYFKGLHFGH